jgi:hypothetical protein
MASVSLAGLPNACARAVLGLWNNHDDRRVLKKAGLKEQDIQDVKKQFKL